MREQVTGQEFVLETSKTEEQIRAAAARAAGAATRLPYTTTEVLNEDNTLMYVVKGPAGVVKMMAILVEWKELPDGRRVSLTAPNFVTNRPALLFIPIGPARAPALPSLKRFSAALRSELTGAEHNSTSAKP